MDVKEALVGMFFAAFKNEEGPKIISTYPENCIPRDAFNEISDYVTTIENLCGRFLCIKWRGFWIIGKPLSMFHTKYFRNNILFNACLVVDGDIDIKCVGSFEIIADKLAMYFGSIEIDHEYVSKRIFNEKWNSDMETDHLLVMIPGIDDLLGMVFNGLKESGYCEFIVNDNNIWRFSLENMWDEPRAIKDHDVPIAITDLNAMVNSEWDLALQTIIPHINGANYVKRIKKLTNMSASRIESALQHLLYYDCIRMIDIFKLSNHYRVTNKLRLLFTDKELKAACVTQSILDPNNTPPEFRDIFSFYSNLSSSLPLQKVCQDEQLLLKNIDVRKCVIFGILNGIIKRLHRYPVNYKPQNHSSKIKVELGVDSLDAICVKESKPYYEISQMFLTTLIK